MYCETYAKITKSLQLFFQKPSYKHYDPHRRQHDRRGTPNCAYDDANWTRNPTTALLEATKGPTDTSLPGGKLAPANRRQSQTALPKRIWVQGCSSYKVRRRRCCLVCVMSAREEMRLEKREENVRLFFTAVRLPVCFMEIKKNKG